jgi:hypothetical protein
LNLIEIIALYLAQFDDYYITLLCIKTGLLGEGNVILSKVGRTWYTFAIFKFGLASLIVYAIVYVFKPLFFFIYIDTILETAVSLYNTFMLYYAKSLKVR